MKNLIRSIVLASIAVAAVAFTATAAHAESRVNVPFSFKVGNKTCPAGQYLIFKEAGHDTVTLKSKDAAVAFTWILAPGDINPGASEIVLSFDEFNQDHALRTVQFGSLITHRLDKRSDWREHASTRIIEGGR